jgi:hypothetical protein
MKLHSLEASGVAQDMQFICFGIYHHGDPKSCPASEAIQLRLSLKEMDLFEPEKKLKPRASAPVSIAISASSFAVMPQILMRTGFLIEKVHP